MKLTPNSHRRCKGTKEMHFIPSFALYFVVARFFCLTVMMHTVWVHTHQRLSCLDWGALGWSTPQLRSGLQTHISFTWSRGGAWAGGCPPLQGHIWGRDQGWALLHSLHGLLYLLLATSTFKDSWGMWLFSHAGTVLSLGQTPESKLVVFVRLSCQSQLEQSAKSER